MKRSVYIVDITSAPMASAASRRGPTRVLARQRRAASSQTASITRFRPATIRAGRYVAPRSPHQLKTRSPSHRTMATLTTRVHSSQTAWLAAASAQGSSSTAHQANSSQVSAPVWYVWPSNASRAPSRMPASASRAPGMAPRAPAAVRRRNPAQAAASAQTANRAWAPANRWTLLMSCQLAATQQMAALPSSKTPSQRVLRARN